MADAGQTLRYLRDCYRADSRSGGIYNLLDSKVEHLHFFAPRERLLSSLLEALPLGREKAGGAARAARLYAREKRLLYASPSPLSIGASGPIPPGHRRSIPCVLRGRAP